MSSRWRDRGRLVGRTGVGSVWLAALAWLPPGAGAGPTGFPPSNVPVEVAPMQAPGPIIVRSVDDLADLTAPQLEALYRQGAAAGMPAGKVRGRALYPDSRFPRAKSNAAKLAWQGKVFDPESGTAVNRFFGVRAVRGTVYSGQSWLDGGPALILDYQDTSRIYGNYRDEIRQVAPGVYLGLMYDRTTNPPAFKMYFAFTDR